MADLDASPVRLEQISPRLFSRKSKAPSDSLSFPPAQQAGRMKIEIIGQECIVSEVVKVEIVH